MRLQTQTILNNRKNLFHVALS